MQAGMKDFIPKPIHIEELQEKIIYWGKWISEKKQTESNRSELLNISTIEDVLPIQDASGKGLYKNLFQLYLKKSIPMIEKIENAFREKNSIALRDLSHTLKGMSLNLGAQKLAQVLQWIEKYSETELESPTMQEKILSMREIHKETCEEIQFRYPSVI
jgi:HPt (histidine-containing phosphotransfer) domain-containing protein